MVPERDETSGSLPRDVAPAGGGRRSLGQAVATALILLGLLVGAFLAGPRAFLVLILVVVSIALFELLDALIQGGRRVSIPVPLGATILLIVAAYLHRADLFALGLVVAVLGTFLLALRPARGSAAASDVAWMVLGVAWVGGGGAAATAILVLPDGLSLLVAFVLIVALDDIAAYFAGTTFGRHKMAPSISAHKSWEGFAGGLGGALAGGILFGALLESLGMVHGAAVGAICGLLAPAGDLAESLFKREVGIKDSGRLLPGHGGLLDRLDAIVFCAPAVFLYLRFVA